MEKNTYEMTGASRKRLLNSMAKLDRCSIDKKEVLYVTLTYDEKVERHEYKKHLNDITQAITKKYGGFGVFRWELQKQKSNGSIRFVWYGVPYMCHKWLAKRWDEIIGVTGDAVIELGYVDKMIELGNVDKDV